MDYSTDKYSNIDPKIFQVGHAGVLFTYGNRTFLLWKDRAEYNYMIKRLDGKIDHPSVKWDIECKKEECYYFYLDLKLDQVSSGGGSGDEPEIFLRILLYNFENSELLILDLSSFGSLVGDVKRTQLAYKIDKVMGLWLIGSNLYFVAENRFFTCEIMQDYTIQVIGSQLTPFDLQNFIMMPNKSMLYTTKVEGQKTTLMYSPGPDFYQQSTLVDSADSIIFVYSSFSRYLVYKTIRYPEGNVERIYYYVNTEAAKVSSDSILSEVKIPKNETKIYHLLETDESISMYCSASETFYFYFKDSQLMFKKTVKLQSDFSMRGFVIDKKGDDSTLNTRMLITTLNEDFKTEIYYNKFDFTHSYLKCNFAKVTPKTPNYEYEVETYMGKILLIMEFKEIYREMKYLVLIVASSCLLVLALGLIIKKLCRKRRQRGMLPDSLRVSLVEEENQGQEEFNINYIKEVYDSGISNENKYSDLYD